MVKHIVFWKLKEEAHGLNKGELASAIKEKLEALNGKIDSIKKLEVGADFKKTETSADLALYSEFENQKGLEAYIVHPLHQEVAAFVGEAAAGRGEI